MSQRIDQLHEELRAKLKEMENGVSTLKAKIDGKAAQAEKDSQAQLAALQKRIEENHPKVAASAAEARSWVETRKAATKEKVAEWKTKHETAKLKNRADNAEGYAAASIEIALAAADEAERATLEALIARQDAQAALAG